MYKTCVRLIMPVLYQIDYLHAVLFSKELSLEEKRIRFGIFVWKCVKEVSALGQSGFKSSIDYIKRTRPIRLLHFPNFPVTIHLSCGSGLQFETFVSI